AIESRDLPAMEAHGSLRDRQAQPNAPGQASPRIIQAVKWLEQFSQSILRNTRPRVAHAKHNLSTAGPLLARQLNLDRRPLLRIADRIAHHILYRAVQQRIVPPHTPVALGDYRVNMAMSLLRFKLRILGNAGH